MKKIFFDLFILSAFSLVTCKSFSQATIRNHLVHIKGTLAIIHTYKGGAAPTDEMLEKLSKPIPATDAQFFLKKSYYSSRFYLLQTDSTGNFDLNIKPGVYNIYLSNEIAKKEIAKNDSLSICEEQFKIESHGTLRVLKKGNSPFEITIREKRSPCEPLVQMAPPKQN